MALNFKQNKKRYTKPNRLADVIRLISLLSMHRNTFKSEQGIEDALRGKPLSADTKGWNEIVEQHPEFFRPNEQGTQYALVIRSYFPEDTDPKKPEGKLRGPLSVDETQTMIDFAVSLYDKEVENNKISGIWVPVVVAIIVLIGQVYNTLHANNATADAAKTTIMLKDSVQQLNVKIDRLTKIIQPKK